MSDPSSSALDWESRYQEGRTGWERPAANPAFLAWRTSGALSPCRILVPGAGRSAEPEALAEAGFSVVVVDAAESAVAAQRTRLAAHAAEIVRADLLAWEPERPFDAIYDQTCLCALPPAVLPAYAERLHRWLRPGGTLFVLFMQTGRDDGPPFHCDLDAMRRLFPAPLWQWPDALPETVPHPFGFAEQPAALRRPDQGAKS
ncbi:MAG: methyltransferase domain-containing protein [Acidisphaera sp.]|nr:methyltransferase domain-containing protein [Acidisphaera sp.]